MIRDCPPQHPTPSVDSTTKVDTQVFADKIETNASCQEDGGVGSLLLQRMYPCTELVIYAAGLSW